MEGNQDLRFSESIYFYKLVQPITQMKTLLFIIAQLLLISFCACSQSYLNVSRKHIERMRQWNDTKYHVDKVSTDSTLVYKMNDPKVKPCELIYQFDKNNKCISEAHTQECERCYQGELLTIVGPKHPKWKMIDSTRYVYKNMELTTHY